ncbi:N-acyl-D-glucosamine 2-epimerase [Paenibacillus thermotolerans]|uniref:N-acyl-D-glucosamine 2-epimerase n=1 Tax=Paenibacillus thermotolerans TaxID=3027807 RepID=UPI002367E4B3|nr:MULTISPECIES: N-acyl-D-glucosamine 2-epimerase [unclassified Paenibacillus]
MRNGYKLIMLLLTLLLITACTNAKKVPEVAEVPESPELPASDHELTLREKALTGPSITLDPNYAYYKDRSMDSVAEEIELAGYHTVHYPVVNENFVNGEFIDALHDRGIAVWLMVFGNGSYSRENFPDDWPSWKMEQLDKENNGVGGFIYLSHFSKPYVQWKKSALAKVVAEYPFDGVEVLEPFFPEWDGINQGVYGDVGPLAQAAFKEATGLDMPNFKDPGSPDYYKTNTDLYDKWVEFRVEAVNNFVDELINGEGGVRDAKKDILVASWTLAIDAGPDSFEKLREYQGMDAASMVTKVKPDIHFFQTHWPDWIKPESELPASYINAYQPFIDKLREQHPDIPIGLQADNGSIESMRKSRAWMNALDKQAEEIGFSAWTIYEYSMGAYMYEEPPVPKRASRSEDGKTVTISFNKRIAALSAYPVENYRFKIDGEPAEIAIDNVTVDGNRIRLHSDSFPETAFEIEISGIQDTPDRWLYSGFPANEVPPGSTITVE